MSDEIKDVVFKAMTVGGIVYGLTNISTLFSEHPRGFYLTQQVIIAGRKPEGESGKTRERRGRSCQGAGSGFTR